MGGTYENHGLEQAQATQMGHARPKHAAPTTAPNSKQWLDRVLCGGLVVRLIFESCQHGRSGQRVRRYETWEEQEQ